MDSVEGPESTPRPMMQQQQKINRSMTIESVRNIELEKGRTNMSIPSASAFQFSTLCLSSSAAISRYIEKIGSDPPEPTKVSEMPCGV